MSDNLPTNDVDEMTIPGLGNSPTEQPVASPGQHRLRITKKPEVRKSKTSENFVMHFYANVVQGEDQGCLVYWNFTLIEAFIVDLKRCCVCFGVQLNGDKLNRSDFIGAEGDVLLKAGTYNGKPTAEVQDFILPDEAASAEEDEDI